MSSLLLDAGDFQRLDRERTLTEQAPRQAIEDDRTPDEDWIRAEGDRAPAEEDDGLSLIVRGLLMALEERL